MRTSLTQQMQRQIQLGDTVHETIQISVTRKTKNDLIWYGVINQVLIARGYKQTRNTRWEGEFIFDREERFSIRTPAERALKEAIKVAGKRSVTISLVLGKFPKYQLSTRDIFAKYDIKHLSYLKRLTQSISIHIPPKNKPRPKPKKLDVYEVACLYRDGLEVAVIAKKLRTTQAQIYMILNNDIFNF
ncbi:TPA: hypothetical protein ACX6NV_003139 [Photobacterium damselae]